MKTPQAMMERFEQAAIGLTYGTVTLTLAIKEQGKRRYLIAREESHVYNEEPPVSRDLSSTKETG